MSGEKLRQAAIAQVVLEGVPLPAQKRDLLAYAHRQETPHEVLAALALVPDREYAAIDEVGEAIVHVQPALGPKPASEPSPESGDVPGGAAYLEPGAEPDGARDERAVQTSEEEVVREPAPAGDGVPEKGSKGRKPRAKTPARSRPASRSS